MQRADLESRQSLYIGGVAGTKLCKEQIWNQGKAWGTRECEGVYCAKSRFGIKAKQLPADPRPSWIVQRADLESRQSCAARAVRLFETLDCIIGRVAPCATGWNVEFAPSGCLIRDRDECATWITVRRDEYAEPKVGDFITVTVPKVLRIDSKPNPTPHRGEQTTKGENHGNQP